MRFGRPEPTPQSADLTPFSVEVSISPLLVEVLQLRGCFNKMNIFSVFKK
jgi:hypothetical protein